MAPARRPKKSQYTLDRGMPGAFEGETVSRRRFMTGTVHGAGMLMTAGMVIPAVGFAIGPVFKNVTLGWQTVGTPDLFPAGQLPAGRDHDRAGDRRGGQEHRLRPQAQPEGRHAAGQRLQPLGRDHLALRAPRLLGALGAGGRALHLPLPRLGLRRRRACASAGPPPRPLDRFYTRLHDGFVQVGPRYSVNTELRAFSPRDPGEPLDGIGQYAISVAPDREKASACLRRRRDRRRRGPRLPKPPLPPAFLPRPLPPGTQRGAPRTPLDHAAESGKVVVDWIDERTSAVGRDALGHVPQGAEGHQLVLHARLGDDVRLPLAGGHRRLPRDVLPAGRLRRRLRVGALHHQRASSSATSFAACTSGARR